MANEENLIPFKPGDDPRRNKNGRPVGSKSLSTLVRELEREDFDWSDVPNKQADAVEYTGSPWKAVVRVALGKAIAGDIKAMEWLRKSGYGDKLVHEFDNGFFSADKLVIQVVDARPKPTEPATEPQATTSA